MENYENKGEAKRFYMNLKDYHDRSRSILKLIIDYFEKVKRSYNQEYMAVRFEDFKLIESTSAFSKEYIDKFENWIQNKNNEDLFDSIFKIELDEKVFLFKIFDFGKGDIVLAGYNLEDSVSVRSFLASFNEMKIQEKYERILNII